MRSQRALAAMLRPALVLVALALAGCAGEPGPSAPGVQDDDVGAPFVAYHASARSLDKTRWSVFAIRPDGTADRILYDDDRSGDLRVPAGIEYPEEDLRWLLDARGGNLNRSAGALVREVERGALDDAARAEVAALRALPWPVSPDLDDPGRDDVARVRADGSVEVLRLFAATPEAAEIVRRFALLQRGFEVRESMVALDVPGGATPEDESAPCLRTDVVATPSSVREGGSMLVEVNVTSCEARAVTLGDDPCGDAPVLRIALWRAGSSWLLADEAGAARADGPGCGSGGDPRVLAPGETLRIARTWNVRLAECDAAGACSERPAPPGEYDLIAAVSYAREAGQAVVRVLPAEAQKARLLLALESGGLTATGDPKPIPGYFGGHCAPATYALDPPVVTMRFARAEDANASALVIQDFRGGTSANHTYTTSADRIELRALEDGATSLPSPFNRTGPAVNVTLEGDVFVVDGVRLPEGAQTTVRHEFDIEAEGGTLHATRVVTLRHVGLADVLREEGGMCA